jgi:hypothetical protein
MQYTICFRNNYSIENCRFKNNPINCQLCGIIGHSAKTLKNFRFKTVFLTFNVTLYCQSKNLQSLTKSTIFLNLYLFALNLMILMYQ